MSETTADIRDRALREALQALRYIAYGDIIEGIRPSRPDREAHWAVQGIERLLAEDDDS